MNGRKFKNEEDGERQKLHGTLSSPFRVEELEKAKKDNLKKQRKKKKKGKKPEEKEGAHDPQTSATTMQNTQKDPGPEETEDLLVGYGTNAMIYNNNMGESSSSEDEGIEDYKIGGYHPAHIGYASECAIFFRERYLNRYVILQKLGWGHFSTVWLAKDLTYDTFVALKIQKSAQHYLEAAFDEVEILQQVSTKWRSESWKQPYLEYTAGIPVAFLCVILP